MKQNNDAKDPRRLTFNKIIGDPRFIFLVSTLIVVVVFLLYRGAAQPRTETFYRILMDTSVELRFQTPAGQNAEALQEAVFSEMAGLEMLFSRTIPESEVSEINRMAGREAVAASEHLIYLLEKALYYGRISNGAFDPTIAPVLDSWGFLGQDYRLPGEEEIERLLPFVDYRLVEVNNNPPAVFLPHEQMAIDLGGIAKGYIVDQALEKLQEAGVTSAFINAGGDLAFIGGRADGEPWRVGIRHPHDENKVIAVLSSLGGAIVTSGDYEREFEVDGISYHHIIDPQSGMPARDLASVTIVAHTATAADALSTAVFVLGPQKGLALIEELPGVEGVLITPGLEVLVSSGLEGLLELHL